MIDRQPPRIDDHIRSDGEQPHETARTRSQDYSDFNLRGYSDLAKLGERVGADLWSYRNANGATFETALDYLAPYATGEQEWPFKQISPPKYNYYVQTFRRAAQAYDAPRFEELIAEMPLDGDGIIGNADLARIAAPNRASSASAA